MKSTLLFADAWDDPRLTMFLLRPLRRSRRCFIVVVADTNALMRAAIGQLPNRRPKAVHAKLLACCLAVRSSDPKWKGLIGFLFFSKDTLGSGMVAHEMAHAGFRVIEYDGLRLEHWRSEGNRSKSSTARYANRVEERYADVVEHMTRQFWIEAFARGIAAP